MLADEVQEAVADSEIIPSLCNALRHFALSPRVIEPAALAIGNLCLLMRKWYIV
jgi:hypothetical protein